MTFHGGFKETIVFETWETKTVGREYSIFSLVVTEKIVLFFSAFVGSWIVIFLLAAFYEGLKTFRDVLAQRDICSTCSPSGDRQTTM